MRPYIFTNDTGIFIGKILLVANEPNSNANCGDISLCKIESIPVDNFSLSVWSESLTATFCTKTYTTTDSKKYIEKLIESGSPKTKQFIKDKKKLYVIVGTIHGKITHTHTQRQGLINTTTTTTTTTTNTTTTTTTTTLQRQGLFGYTVDVIEINWNKLNIVKRLSKKKVYSLFSFFKIS